MASSPFVSLSSPSQVYGTLDWSGSSPAHLAYNGEYLEDMINRMVKEEVLLQIDPNLYLFSVLTDTMTLDIKRIKEAKEILERKGRSNVNTQ